MNCINWLQYLAIFKWQDGFALFIIIFTTYRFLRFLSSHNTLQLLGYCYALFGTITVAYIIKSYALVDFLVQNMSLILVVMILMHQKSLQKNWLGIGAAKKISENYHWLDNISRILIWAKTQNLYPIFLIENNENLNPLLENYITIQANYNERLVRTLISNPENQIIVINQDKIKSSSEAVLKTNFPEEIDLETKLLHISSLANAIVVYCEKNINKICIMHQGNKKLTESQNCSILLRQFLNQNVNREANVQTVNFQTNKRTTTTQI